VKSIWFISRTFAGIMQGYVMQIDKEVRATPLGLGTCSAKLESSIFCLLFHQNDNYTTIIWPIYSWGFKKQNKDPTTFLGLLFTNNYYYILHIWIKIWIIQDKICVIDFSHAYIIVH
jgi:hypothetical protein